MSSQQILRELACDDVANRFFFEHLHPLTLRCRFCAWCNQFRFIGYPYKHIGQLLVLSGFRNSCDGSCSLMLLNCCAFFARKLLLVEMATAQVLFGPHILDSEQTSHCAPACEVLSKKSAETVGQHPQREKKSEYVGVRADICVFFIQSAEHWIARDVKQVQTLDPIHELRQLRHGEQRVARDPVRGEGLRCSSQMWRRQFLLKFHQHTIHDAIVQRRQVSFPRDKVFKRATSWHCLKCKV